MNTDLKVKSGRLILQEISFRRVLVRNVMRNDSHSNQGKIALPRDLINKEVYVIPVEGTK